MDCEVAYVSKDGNGKMKIEYLHKSEKRVMLWEAKGNSAIETTFDNNGAILMQRLVKLDQEPLDSRAINALKSEGISKTEEKEYWDIKFDKPCPKCTERKLQRYVEAFSGNNEMPIMPLYHCPNCGTKSYYLTDQYLEYLVDSNAELFNDEEVSEKEANKRAFMDELKGYIIRIFASKKIMCIE
jgi:hypothetical protein